MLTAEVEPFDDEGENRSAASIPRTLHTSGTILHGGSSRPDSWIITLEGHSYDIVMQSDTALVALAAQVKTYAKIFSPMHQFPELNVTALEAKLEDLHVCFSRKEQEAKAVAFYKDFEPPLDMLTRDSIDLQQLGSIEALIARRQTAIEPTRFNEAKARRMFSADPDIERIVSIANGAIIDLPPSFVHTVHAQPNRPIQQRIPKVFLAQAYKLWAAGHALFLENKVLAGAPDFLETHNSQAHWISQANKDEGRFLIDPTNADPGFHALNSAEAKELGRARYGRAHYPTIRDFATQWANLIQLSGRPMSEFSFYKDDWVNAFGQVTLTPTSAKLMCMPIGDHHTFLQFTGNFGHCSLPAIFHTGLSAPTIRLIQPLITGCLGGYCDDHAGMSHDSTVHADKAIGQAVLRAVVSDDVVCKKKDEAPAKEQVIIGYHVSTMSGLTRPPERACNKMLLVFVSCDVNAKHPLSFWALVAGLAERYSWILVGMRSFVQPFHHMKHTVGTRKGNSKAADSSARFCLEIWKIMAVMLYLNPIAVSIPWMRLADSTINQPTALTKSDASPYKLCAGIYDISGALLSWTTYKLPYVSTSHSSQNHREFMGLLLAMILAYKTKDLYGGQVHVHMRWTSDNTSAIKWATSHKCSSRAGQVASMAITWFQVIAQIDIVQVLWTPGITMEEIDDGSRDTYNEKLIPTLRRDFEHEGSALDQLFRICDPDSAVQVGDHHAVFLEVNSLLRKVLIETIASTF